MEGDTVTHDVNAGLIPGWADSEQFRPFQLDHGCLIIGSGKQKLA